MNLHFEANLDFQLAAIEAVCDLFHGQEVNQSVFTVTRHDLNGQGTLETDDKGFGNRLQLLPEALLDNLRAVQLRNGLAPSDTLDEQELNFTVEMETGTGKTYVYLRTILELNARYGFTKFVIVVPSVAIKEGVYKTLDITREHFNSLYAGQPYNYFAYDSSKLGQLRSYATSNTIQIMVVTVQSINKKEVNTIYGVVNEETGFREGNERTGGEKPIDLIRATRPVIIVDEPQSVDGGLRGKGKEALNAMQPLCTLRYSATHKQAYHMVYRLDAVEAYQRELVKQIEVAAAEVDHSHNDAYVGFVEAKATASKVKAKLELDVVGKGGRVTRKTVLVDPNDSTSLGRLDDYTGGRELYAGYRVAEVTRKTNPPQILLEYPGGSRWLEEGQSIGGVDELAVARLMIRRTIKHHLDKELLLRPRGIKVLSLFFVERVALYREYDEGGEPVKGPYAKVFEQEYERLRGHPDYRTLFESADFAHPTHEVHNGYFSRDKKGRFTEPKVNARGELSNAKSREDAERAYSLIMRDKEELLSLRTPLKFIFSHSALREGWDNPNVFQICALREMGTERQRRQTIGRGLRIAVNQDGQRVRGRDVNILTVVARESYRQFADELQKEIERETGIKFGYVLPQNLAQVSVLGESGEREALGHDRAAQLVDHLQAKGYLDARGKVQEQLKRHLEAGSVELPSWGAEEQRQIVNILTRHAKKVEVKDAAERRTVRAQPEVLDSEEFRQLWERIKYKTTYQLDFDDDALREQCTAEVRRMPRIPVPRLRFSTAQLEVDAGGVSATEKVRVDALGRETHTVASPDIPLPDVISVLQDQTQLTRQTIVGVLIDSGRLDDFRRNPQRFVEEASKAINLAKRAAIVDGIKYHVIGDQQFYGQELFRNEELQAYLDDVVSESDAAGKEVVRDMLNKTPYEFIRYDSGVERDFAQELLANSRVKFFAKLPNWFRVPTPLGDYNPDWAITAIDEAGDEHVYLVVETKSSLYVGDLREREQLKIDCGEAHFDALGSYGEQLSMFVGEPKVKFRKATEWTDLDI